MAYIYKSLENMKTEEHESKKKSSDMFKENCIEYEQHFLMYCQGNTNIKQELDSHILSADAHYTSLSGNERTIVSIFLVETIKINLK